MYEDILNRLKGLNKSIVPCIPAVVKSVQVVTCTVVMLDGLELSGVRLKAGNDEGNEFIRVIPRINSIVLIAQIGDDETSGEYYVCSYNEVEEISVKMKETFVVINKNNIQAVLKDSSLLINKDNAFLSVGTDESQSKITISKTEILIEPKLWLTVQNSKANLKSILQEIIRELKELRVVFSDILPSSATAGGYPVSGYAKIDPLASERLTNELVKLNNLLN